MSSAALTARPRYGSAAEVAAYAGVSSKTIRRPADDGTIRGLKARRRLVIPFEDADGLIGESQEAATMATAQRPEPPAPRPLLEPITREELMRRNRAAVELLDSWATEGDEEEQRETMAVLRKALGPGRIGSSRPLFP
jgi:hypothetical protein